MPAAVVGGVIAGVGAIGASAMSASAQKKAAKSANKAQQAASAQELEIAKMQEQLFRDIYAKNTTNFQPYLQSGYGAQSVAMQLLGLKPMTADQFNKGEWYVPGTVDYQNPAPAGTSNGTGTGTGTTTTPAPTPAPTSTWEQDALAYIMPHIGPKRTAEAMRISDPAARLRYLQGVFHSDERNIFNAWASGHPQTATPAPTTGVPAPATPAPASTGFAAERAYGPNNAAATPAAPTNMQQQAQAAIQAGADPMQVSARMAAMGYNSGVNQQ